MKIVSVVGARPQFIKAALVSSALRSEGHSEILVHTGQHYDFQMSQVFFDELPIPNPDYNLEVGSDTHAVQTGQMLTGLESIFMDTKPDWVLVYGDTNSTLAGALAAAKLHIPIAHVEAGLRSYNRRMPEEINRILTDHLSDLLLCPSETAVEALKNEGIQRGVHLVGDVMADILAFAVEHSRGADDFLSKLGITHNNYFLATIHRAENTDDPERMVGILKGLNALPAPVIFPVHPRTRKVIETLQFQLSPNVHLIEPVSYLRMVCLEQSARAILTDSGGIQKEAYWLKVPCITIRSETEWVETVALGWNVLVEPDEELIFNAAVNFNIPASHPSLYGDGKAAQRCAEILGQSSCDD